MEISERERSLLKAEISDSRALPEVPENALDLLQGTAEVFGDLGGQHVRVR